MEIKTNRYLVNFIEICEGGPAGYESTYLTSEGEKADEKLYALLKEFEGKLLPVENEIIRQRNGEILIDAISENKPLGIASGFKPSGAYHFGHKLTSSAVSFFQKNGAQIFIPIADIEAEMDMDLSREKYQFWAADNILDWGANGVNLDAAHTYLQSEEFRVNKLAYVVARSLKFDMALDTYGIKKLIEDFPFLFAGITQVGDILLPQYPDFGNYHSFMLSGQDQDGHMKMTTLLVKKSLENKITIPGLQTIPSSFYIPHIRGFKSKTPGEDPKMSSSWEEGTLYLGSGPEHQGLEDRIKSSLAKFDSAYKNLSTRENLKLCALDMVKYIDFFNKNSEINFNELIHEKEYQGLIANLEKKKTKNEQKIEQRKIDNYLIDVCNSLGQDNIKIVRDLLKDAITDHQVKRKLVFEYALNRVNYVDTGLWDFDNVKPEMPSFWKVPNRAKVDERKMNKTRWYHIINNMKDKLIP